MTDTLPKPDPLDIIRRGGLLKNRIIPNYKGEGHVFFDIACGQMLLSALLFRRGKEEDTKREMKKAFGSLKSGERYHPWEEIKDGRPYPAFWPEERRDCWRFGIELYNALAEAYQEAGVDVDSIDIKEGRLVPLLVR